MPDFIKKANENQPFNNGGSTLGKSGGAPVDGPQSPLSETDQGNTKSIIQANNNTAQSQHINSNINGALKNAARLNTVKIDPLTGYPECPGSQFRVTWPTSFEWEALPPGSENYSRMSPCGCWLDLGVGLIDIIEGIFLVTGAPAAVFALDKVYGYFRQGGKRLDDAIEGLKKSKKLAANFPESYNILRRNYLSAIRALDQTKTNTKLLLRKATLFANNFNANWLHNKQVLANHNAYVRQKLLTDFLQDPDQFPFQAQLIYDADANGLSVFDVPGLETYVSPQSLNNHQQILSDIDISYDEWQFWLNKAKQHADEIDDIDLQIANYQKDIADIPWKRAQEEADIDAAAIREAKANETTFGGMMANLGYACAYAGIAIDLFSGSLYKPKVCYGRNHKILPNLSTCECECKDGYEHCLNDERTVANFLFGIVNVDTIEQATICSPPCCGGQVKYEFSISGTPSCGCACLGDITFGTPISGGGSQDDTWIAGNGCGCVRHLGFGRTQPGKCVSQFTQERNVALGKVWDPDECDFVCPQTGTSEGQTCGGYARRKKITWTDSQGNTWPNQDSLCECECVEPDDWSGAWPPGCQSGYRFNSDPTVCNCVECPPPEGRDCVVNGVTIPCGSTAEGYTDTGPCEIACFDSEGQPNGTACVVQKDCNDVTSQDYIDCCGNTNGGLTLGSCCFGDFVFDGYCDCLCGNN